MLRRVTVTVSKRSPTLSFKDSAKDNDCHLSGKAYRAVHEILSDMLDGDLTVYNQFVYIQVGGQFKVL